MSIFRAVAVGAALMLGVVGTSEAQTPGSAPRDSARARGHDGMRPGKAGMRRGMKRGEMRHRGPRDGQLMRDLNLTSAQQSQISAIRDKFRTQYRTLHDQNRTQVRSMRDARVKGDTTAAARARSRQHMEQAHQRAQALHQQEQNEIRALLTTEQRAKWDARSQQRKQGLDGRREGMKAKRRDLPRV